MKAAAVIAKVLAVLAAVIGAVYVLATYGEKIVAWARGVLESMPKCECTNEEEEVEETEAPVEEEPACEVVEEIVEEVQEAVEEVVEEVAPEATAEVVADEADFEG